MKKSVCAVIRKGNQILGVSRKDDPTNFGLPGGKVDEGESLEEAIMREVMEETGLLVSDIVATLYVAVHGEYQCTTYLVEVEGRIDHEAEEGVVKWVSPEQLEAGGFGEYNKALFSVYPIPRESYEISPERHEEVREVIHRLREADETGEVSPHLYADAQYALLDLLDRVRVVGIPKDAVIPYFEED